MISDNVAVPQFGMLSREQCESIHRASLEILRRTGVRVYHDEALDLLRQTNAVLIDGNRVRLQPGLVEWALAQAPSRIPLCRRGSDEVIAPLEGRIVSFGTGSDCLTYLDPRTFSIMAALLAGNNLTHDVGYLESGKTTSPEMIVLCDEIISMLRHFVAGISFDDESMALDVIHQVGPDGDFLSTRHTLQHFRHMWRPALFSRLGGEAWANKGGKRLGEILREKTLSIIEEHHPEPLDDNVRAEVEYVLKNS